MEWTPHEEDFNDFGLEYHSQAGVKETTNQLNNNEQDEVNAAADDVDDGNLADDDEEDDDDETDATAFDGERKKQEDSVLASDTVEEPTQSKPPSFAPVNPFANISFTPTPPTTKFTFTPSQSIFSTRTPSFSQESLDDLFKKKQPTFFLDQSQTEKFNHTYCRRS